MSDSTPHPVLDSTVRHSCRTSPSRSFSERAAYAVWVSSWGRKGSLVEKLRMPFFIAALVLAAVVVLVQVGAPFILGLASTEDITADTLLPTPTPEGLGAALSEVQDQFENGFRTEKPPGIAIRTLALVDSILIFTLALMGLSLLIGHRKQARIQGIITLVFSIVIVVLAIVAILIALAKLLLMVSLFLAFPFGTIAYMAIYGFFNRGGASATLGLLMTLKIAFAVCLVLAHQRFLQNKGLILMIITAFLGNVIVGFLHGLVPRFLVSITDAIAAIVVAILALIWAIILLVSAILSIIKALPPS